MKIFEHIDCAHILNRFFKSEYRKYLKVWLRPKIANIFIIPNTYCQIVLPKQFTNLQWHQALNNTLKKNFFAIFG